MKIKLSKSTQAKTYEMYSNEHKKARWEQQAGVKYIKWAEQRTPENGDHWTVSKSKGK